MRLRVHPNKKNNKYSQMKEIDLRSDTVTKPTKEMLQAIMSAEVGDDVYKEDPSVNALEEKLAKMFGMDEALFFPTGSMANQAAIKLHTQPAEQLICEYLLFFLLGCTLKRISYFIF